MTRPKRRGRDAALARRYGEPFAGASAAPRRRSGDESAAIRLWIRHRRGARSVARVVPCARPGGAARAAPRRARARIAAAR
ncbi:hypothetical protein D0U02_19695 [Burkholderia pseudomallei]|nr:hypothetical protein BOC51_27550 [Burkholderia pseudomallei]OMT74033.1 hypothetical protein AQ762_01995 [Burkholderia pseudomallei]OMV92683.1 hypothetical protein AQ801_20995 [Burkholderia pseudomallei]OMW07175.1 hypothetical protein AQ803_03980 [Burkholderia pseudomallei]OND87466.1 hypothetical protein AQ942_22435 [Burkholderia pseudomallei]